MYRQVGIFEDSNDTLFSVSETLYNDGENPDFVQFEMTHEGRSHFLYMNHEQVEQVLTDTAAFYGFKVKKKRKRWWSRKNR